MQAHSENWMAASALRDLDVDQCVEEMFWALAPAPAMPPKESQRFLQMVVPRPAVPAKSQPLPHELREELLGLCAELVQMAKSQKLQTLMICGVEAGVGASFVANQLSRMLAEISRLRIAVLTVIRPEEQRPNSLRNSVVRRDFDYLLFRTERPNLMEIASAQGAITLTELLGRPDAASALRQMQQEFDFIVIDTPAVAMYAEVALLAANFDGVILVAEQNVTSLRQMDRAHQRLSQGKAHVLGVVLNRQPMR